MSEQQPDPLEAFQMLKQAFEGDGASEARVRALIGAHVTSNLLLAERIADLDQMLGLLVAELQGLRLQRREQRGSNGRADGSSKSDSTSTRTPDMPEHRGSDDER